LADPKDKQSNQPAAIDPTVDREQGLALQFADPGLDEIFSLPAEDAPLVDSAALEAAPPTLAAEVADAVQELVLDLNSSENTELLNPAAEMVANAAISNPALDLDLTAEEQVLPDAHETLLIEGAGLETTMHVARSQFSDKMFSLMVEEKSFNDLTETILASLMQAASASAGSILEFDHEKGEFFFRASIGGGDPEKVKAFRVPGKQGIVGHVAESRQSLLLNEMQNESRQLKAISLSTGFEITSCMAFPVLVANRLYGVVELFNKLGGAQFEQADLKLMEDGARMAAKVLEVRFLMAELARRMR
jgi:hypothetical protein